MQPSSPYKSILLLSVLLVLISLFLLVRNIAEPFEFNFWALAILWLNSIPIYKYLFDLCRTEAFPFMGLWGCFISMSYSIPVFFIPVNKYEISDLSIDCLKMAFGGFLLFYFFYYSLYKFITFKSKFTPIPYPANNGRNRFYAYFFLIIYLLTDKIYTVDSLHFIGSLGIYFFLGTYFVLITKRISVSVLEEIIYYLILANEFYTRVLSGAILNIALLLLFYFIISIILKIRFQKIALIILLFVLLYSLYAPVKYQYREYIWWRGNQYTTIEKGKLLLELIVNREKDQTEHFPVSDRFSSNFTWRFSYQASAMSLVLRQTPAFIPFQEGNSYQVLAKFIPRILWKDKPIEDANLQFNKRYNMVDPEVTVSPYPLPVLAEMYMNFGVRGIIIGMFILALIYVLLNRYFNRIENNEINKMYGLAFLIGYISIEGNFTMTFGTIPLILITLFGIFFILNIIYNLFTRYIIVY